MCTGRVDRDFVIEAFKLGAAGVLITACHLPSDCHYISGNAKMKVRMDALAGMLQKLGLSAERFRVDYVSSAEGEKFVSIVKEMSGQLKALGKEKIAAENAKLRPVLDNMLKRKAAASAPVAKSGDQAAAKPAK
jgi:coenzyme F420-reducing hydrogenase delta subunit